MPLGADANRAGGILVGVGALIIRDGRHALRGKTASLGDEEAIGGDAERGVMVESSATTALIVTQAEFLFQFLVIPFDNPVCLAIATRSCNRVSAGKFETSTRHLAAAYDHPAVGTALHAGVRQALAPLCANHRWFPGGWTKPMRGAWMYLYRAVDKSGKTVDFYLRRSRDVNAAKAFLRKAMKRQRTPTKITLDAYAA